MPSRLSLIVALFAGITFFSSCKKDKGSSTPINGIIITGTWKIDYCVEDQVDEAYLFEHYTFVFNTDGVLTAASDTNTTVGSWHADDDGVNEIHIDLGHNPPLNYLTKDWIIKAAQSNTIELVDDDSHGDMEVHFKRQ